MKREGYTLLELLVVIGVLAILLSIGTPGYLRWLATQETQEAAVILSQQIQRTRTESKRGDAKSVVTTTGSSVFTAAGRTIAVAGATIQTTDTLTFQPPYGTLQGSTPRVLTVRSKRISTVTRTVRVISIMGKVVVQ